MFLKSLTLKGFKSFADTTTLDLEPGVTVIVGPNGSGKSNVVDAVAWVLGAQGPRALRSAKMDDVIFAGTPGRPALGRAEVSLTIDNSSGHLPIGFSEVTITRTLFRTGESDYAINRAPCRLLDVQELLSDSGVGRQQHVIVSQGNLDAILSSRPEDRRVVIEEAAGVLKYRRRKERSERRLEATEASLVRLGDLLREVRRQLRPLEKQADAARRHDGLVADLAALRRHLAGRELAVIEARLAAGSSLRHDLDEVEGRLRAALAGLDADISTMEERLGAARQRAEVADLGEAVSGAEALRARGAGLGALLEERGRGVAGALAASVGRDVVASLEAEAARLAEQLVATDADAFSLETGEAEVLDAEASLADETADVDARWDGTDRESAVDPAAEVRSELRALQSAVERTRSERRRLDGRADAMAQRVARLDAETERLAGVVAETGAAEPVRRTDLEEAAVLLLEAERHAGALDIAGRRAEAESHRCEARAEALGSALDEARARAGAQRLSGVQGVVGTLLELVDVDEGWEAAFEAAVGEAIAAVVVANAAVAGRALATLRQASASGAVVAMDPARAPDVAPARAPADEGTAPGDIVRRVGLAAVRDHVRARLPGVDALLDQFLRSAAAVEGGWEEVVAAAADHPDLVVVDRAGDRAVGGVWRIGSGGTGATGTAVEEARRAAADASAAAGVATVAAGEACRRLEERRAERAEAQRALDATAARRHAALDALERSGRERRDAGSDREAADAHHRELTQRLERDGARVAELAAALPELEQVAVARVARAVAERAARARLAERAGAVAALRRDLEVRAAGLEERRALVVRRAGEIDQRLAGVAEERARAELSRARLEVASRATDRLGRLVAVRRQDVDALVGRLRAARAAEAADLRQVTDRLEALRRERASAERSTAETRERRSRADLDAAEARVRLEALTDAVRRDLDCEPEATRGAPEPPLPAGTSATSRRGELERELRLMGPINPLALEEHAALVERHTFLEGQLEDVRAGRRELSKVIRAVDAEIAEVFCAAFADAADNFTALFSTLFPGGQGRLRLTDPDHPLETGIEVEARPSGKNVRRLSLLSGGERSLTAMAFLFAVFRSRPSPFYLMDEVEAALDDVNLQRFLDLVGEFRGEAQLVIVSHQKRTMEAADCLYGVTMAPGGSSQVVCERVRPAPSPAWAGPAPRP